MGFGRARIFRIFFTEYFVLISAGILAGLLPAVLATLPRILSLDTMQALGNIGRLLLLLTANSTCWISIFILANVRERSLVMLNAE